jgi:hypothetical protein
MELIFIVAAAVGAFYLGKTEGQKEIANIRRRKIDNAFSMESWHSNNIFNKVYGVNGVYYSDVDIEVNAPLVIIQSSDLARFVAIKEIATYFDEDDNLNKDKIEKRRLKIAEEYLLKTGMSEDTIKTLNNIFLEK